MFFASRTSLSEGKGCYHIQECFHFTRIKDENLIWFGSESDAEEKVLL